MILFRVRSQVITDYLPHAGPDSRPCKHSREQDRQDPYSPGAHREQKPSTKYFSTVIRGSEGNGWG